MSARIIRRTMQQIVEVVSCRPQAALRAHVERYVGYRLEGFAPGTHRGLPSRHLTFIISLDRPIDVAVMPDPAQSPGAYSALLSGLCAAPAVIAHDGVQAGIAIEMGPLGARALFGLPAGAIGSAVIDLSDVLGPGAASLPDRLASTPEWSERFSILDQVLAAALRDRGAPPPEVARAWQRLAGAAGAIPIGALAREVGWSRRHLAERFRSEIGLAPKTAARVLRFETARRLLERANRPALADVAASCGYADQAHLTREWKQFAGCPPTAWLGEELPSVQDALEATGAH